MDSKQARELIDRYLAGDCTPEEKALVESLYDEELATRSVAHFEIEAPKIKAHIWRETSKHLHRQPVIRSYGHWLTAAAAVIVIVTTGLLFLQQKARPLAAPSVVVQKEINQKSVLDPASEKAMLTLADGTIIPLDDAKKGEISQQAGQKIIKLNNGNIAYAGSNAGGSDGKVIFNTLATPRAAFYHLTLSDGSEAWLNAASSITYPAAFPADERTVSITGEVYFEISKAPRKPFIVHAGDQTIRVLGTHFNVTAYQNDPQIITTLLEGSVKISHQSTEALLKPGDQAAVSMGAAGVKIKQVNAADAIAWKDGFFKFDNEPLGTIIKKLARWYDVDIECTDDIEQKKFWGTFSRSNRLDNLLNSLQQTGDVHFKIDGRRITMMK